MLTEFTSWLGALFAKGFGAAWDLFSDLFIAVGDGVLSAVSSLLAAIPVPSFLTTGMQSLFDNLGAPTLYILGHSGVGAALGVLGAGYAFRLTRKFLTLFQW